MNINKVTVMIIFIFPGDSEQRFCNNDSCIPKFVSNATKVNKSSVVVDATLIHSTDRRRTSALQTFGSDSTLGETFATFLA